MDQHLEAVRGLPRHSRSDILGWGPEQALESSMLSPATLTLMHDRVRSTDLHGGWIQVREGGGRETAEWSCRTWDIWGLPACSAGLPGAGWLGQVWFWLL